MKKWVLISDLIFAFFVCFLPLLCLLRYWRWSLGGALIVASLFGVGTTFFVLLFKKKKDEKLLLKLGEEKEKRLLLSHFALLSSSQCLATLYPHLPVQQIDAIHYVEENETLIFSLFLWTQIKIDDLLPLLKIRLQLGKKAKILCDEATTDAAAFAAQFDVECVQGAILYKQLKEENRLPEKYLSEPHFTKKKKRLPRIWFSKSNSRRFLICGGLLLLSSLLVPFPIYYLCFGGLLVLAAILIRVLGYR